MVSIIVMDRKLPFRALAALLTVASLSACATPPPGKPIVLRRPDRRVATAPAARKPAATPVASTAPATDATPPAPVSSATPAPSLTPEQKQSLFEDFDRYLARPAP